MAITRHCDPSDLKSNPQVTILDVREDAEFRGEHLPGSLHIPLSQLAEKLTGLERDKAVYLICASGIRAAKAADLLQRSGFSDLRVVDGGLQACKAAGHALGGEGHAVWSMERQVRAAAGGLVLTGIVLAVWVHTIFFLLSAFVGAGLVYSAVTNTCTMARVLAHFPWNRSR